MTSPMPTYWIYSAVFFQGSFYLFLISSARFRRQVRYVFINKLWCRTKTQHHQYSTTSQFQYTDNDSQTPA